MNKTKIRYYLSWQRLLALTVLVFMVAVSLAQTSRAQTFSQGYGSDKPLQRGLIVKLKKDDSTKVEPVTIDTAKEAYGVTIGATDASVTLSGSTTENYVATTGHYDVLVTTQNGPITTGDFISVSALEGVGAKATDRDEIIVGRALSGFDGKTGVISTTEVTDNQNKKHPIAIGRISMDVGVSNNPLLRAKQPSVPEFLQKAAQSVAGKEVSATRIYLSVLVFGVTTAIAASLMYSGIRSGVISIGRNPLSKKSIVRTMFQVIVTGMIVFITGIFGVYLLIRL